MTESQALQVAVNLYSIWIGPLRDKLPGYHFERIRQSIRQDWRYRRDKPQFKAVAREAYGHLILLGKARKVLEPNVLP